MPTPPIQNSDKPLTPYDVIGLIKSLKRPEMEKAGLVTKQAILINVLLKFINRPEITSAVWNAGIDGLSNEHKAAIGVKVS